MRIEYEVDHLICWRSWTFGVGWERFADVRESGCFIDLYVGPLNVAITVWNRSRG